MSIKALLFNPGWGIGAGMSGGISLLLLQEWAVGAVFLFLGTLSFIGLLRR